MVYLVHAVEILASFESLKDSTNDKSIEVFFRIFRSHEHQVIIIITTIYKWRRNTAMPLQGKPMSVEAVCHSLQNEPKWILLKRNLSYLHSAYNSRVICHGVCEMFIWFHF